MKRLTMALRAALSTAAGTQGGILLGAGSNVVDTFFHVRGLPEAGTKAYFQSPTAERVVGGA